MEGDSLLALHPVKSNRTNQKFNKVITAGTHNELVGLEIGNRGVHITMGLSCLAHQPMQLVVPDGANHCF